MLPIIQFLAQGRYSTPYIRLSTAGEKCKDCISLAFHLLILDRRQLELLSFDVIVRVTQSTSVFFFFTNIKHNELLIYKKVT
jgi:hypothetical protein